MNSELGFITTLAQESELITKQNFFLPQVKDLNNSQVSAWHELKNITNASFSCDSGSHENLSSTPKIGNIIKLSFSPHCVTRLKQNNTKSAIRPTNFIYKTCNAAFARPVSLIKNINAPKLPFIKKSYLVSNLLPVHKTQVKNNKKNYQLIPINQIIEKIKPKPENSITTKLISSLRSKSNLKSSSTRKNTSYKILSTSDTL
jgi:hypothetical protein